MKKSIILLAALALGFSVMAVAQRAKVISAANYLKFGELDQAKEAIDVASVEEKSKTMAKTWYYRGKIYHALYETKDENYMNLHDDPLSVAYEAYMKIDSMDEKDQYMEDVKKRLEICAMQFVNKGVKEYSSANYGASVKSFEKAISINKFFDKIDTLSIFNAALASERNGDNDKAKEYYNKLIELQYGGTKIFSFLANIYKAEKDTGGLGEVIKRGRERFPDDNNLVIEELNYFILIGEHNKAIENLKLAISKDPDNHNLYYALGSIYDQLGDFDNSEEAYRKAIEISQPLYDEYLKVYKESVGIEEEPQAKKQHEKILEEHFSIVYNFGALYFNEGVNKMKIINTITDNTKYAIEKKAAEAVMIKALPYLEQALELKPNDKNTLTSLKDLYARTGNDEKWREMKLKLEN